jgi:5'-nucleotidase
VAVLSTCCAPLPGTSGGRQSGAVTVQLLAINDLHGHLEPPSGSNGRLNSVDAGGSEYLATHLRNAAADYPNSIVVAAGDLIGASPMVSAMFHDEPIIEALNAMRLAVASVGNHEFDEGHEELLRLKRGGCHPRDGCQDGDGFDGARFEYLAANVVTKTANAPLFPATTIRDVGGVKVGFIGATLTATSEIVPASVTRELTFLDAAAAANERAAELKRQGVSAIVLLIHEGFGPGEGEREGNPNECNASTGGLASTLKRLSSDIAVVISGHTHTIYNCRVGSQLVTSAASYGRAFTRVFIDIDRSTGRIVRTSAMNQIVTRDVARDMAVSAIAAKYTPFVDKVAAVVVGSVSGNLLRAPNAAGESALGNVLADAQLAAASAPDQGGAVVAFMNMGGIRADVIGAPAGSSGGQGDSVTYGDLYSVQPFGNTIMAITMTGDMIRRLLEQQFDNPTPGTTRMLQVSNGFTYTYRSAAPAGQRIDAGSIRLNGRVIAPQDRVRVAVSDFLLGGGDAFAVFKEGTESVAVISDIDALVAYFKGRSPISPPPQDRIGRAD